MLRMFFKISLLCLFSLITYLHYPPASPQIKVNEITINGDIGRSSFFEENATNSKIIMYNFLYLRGPVHLSEFSKVRIENNKNELFQMGFSKMNVEITLCHSSDIKNELVGAIQNSSDSINIFFNEFLKEYIEKGIKNGSESKDIEKNQVIFKKRLFSFDILREKIDSLLRTKYFKGRSVYFTISQFKIEEIKL